MSKGLGFASRPRQVASRAFFKASEAMFLHIEKCSPRYTDEAGYHWQTGDPPCYDKDEHDRLRREETAAWRAYRATQNPTSGEQK